MMLLKNGRYLKAARVLAGLTQRELADAAGIHVNAVKYWERSIGLIRGHAVSRMVKALEFRGVYCRDERTDGGSAIVLRA